MKECLAVYCWHKKPMLVGPISSHYRPIMLAVAHCRKKRSYFFAPQTLSRSVARMADELEASGAAESKEAAPHALPPPPWWHEAGFLKAGNDLLAKFAQANRERDERVAARAERRAAAAAAAEAGGSSPASRPSSPSKEAAPPSPGKGSRPPSPVKGAKGAPSKKEKEGKGKKEGKGAAKGPAPLPPPHLRTSGATLNDWEEAQVGCDSFVYAEHLCFVLSAANDLPLQLPFPLTGCPSHSPTHRQRT